MSDEKSEIQQVLENLQIISNCHERPDLQDVAEKIYALLETAEAERVKQAELYAAILLDSQADKAEIARLKEQLACPTCKGTGEQIYGEPYKVGHKLAPNKIKCPACGGTGEAKDYYERKIAELQDEIKQMHKDNVGSSI